ncbi:MAG: 4'-phosphopantetheinyl transferase superfamily protein [Pseudoflavonifractor sp.]
MLLLASDHLPAWDLLLQALDLPVLPTLGYGPQGKPYFPDLPQICFNLSHSGGLALCGVGDAPLGVDIEVLRPRSKNLPRFVLSDAEYGRYAALGGDWGAFYTLWTRKEAFCKQQGGSIARPRGICPPETPDLAEFSGADWRGAVYAPGAKIPSISWI